MERMHNCSCIGELGLPLQREKTNSKRKERNKKKEKTAN